MKKITFCLAILLLLSAPASCGRRQDILNQIESEKAAESAAVESSIVTMGGGRETIAPEPGTEHPNPDNPSESYAPPVITIPDPNSKYPNNAGYQLTAGINKGDIGYYNGMTIDILQQRFEGCRIGPTAVHFNTPMGIVFTPLDEEVTYFNKLTGNVTHICPDPLCRHNEDCVWASMQKFMYVSDTHMYFTAGDASRSSLYRCDLNRNHIEPLDMMIYNSDEKIFFADGDLVYMQRIVYKQNDAGECCFGVLDCTTKEFTTIYDAKDIWVLAVTGGDTVWFQIYPDDMTIYKANLDFSSQESVMTGSSMSILMHNKDYLLIGESDGGLYTESFLYHIKTGEKTAIKENVATSAYATLDDHYLYYTKDITDEEIAISPLKDYYCYEVPRGNKTPYRAGVYAGDGRVYRFDIKTGVEEVCAKISYNGIPIRITDLVVDGDAVYVAYLTYQDWNNYYNQEYGKQPDGSINYHQKAPFRYMYIDMTNGTVNLLNPYQIG